MQGFKNIDPKELNDNVFKLLDKDWMLLTAGQAGNYNTMTASWGHMGILWNQPVAIAYVRPQRHTFGFMERFPGFSLSFFTEEYRSALQFCGSHSGRDCDKAAETGLTPLETDKGNIAFSEARLIMECRTVYVDDLKRENFRLAEVPEKHYAKGDFHRIYMAEILQAHIA
ncbi:MAG: flavin reductase [Bacteroidetes bacterium]|nr:MAG: flavin reductase [Bacteroidota bacterium]